jgi:hypothetical protein
LLCLSQRGLVIFCWRELIENERYDAITLWLLLPKIRSWYVTLYKESVHTDKNKLICITVHGFIVGVECSIERNSGEKIGEELKYYHDNTSWSFLNRWNAMHATCEWDVQWYISTCSCPCGPTLYTVLHISFLSIQNGSLYSATYQVLIYTDRFFIQCYISASYLYRPVLYTVLHISFLSIQTDSLYSVRSWYVTLYKEPFCIDKKRICNTV